MVAAKSRTDDLRDDSFDVRNCLARPGVRFQKRRFVVCLGAGTLIVAAVRWGSLKLNEGVTQKVPMSTVR
jgi:hypothetical protein